MLLCSCKLVKHFDHSLTRGTLKLNHLINVDKYKLNKEIKKTCSAVYTSVLAPSNLHLHSAFLIQHKQTETVLCLVSHHKLIISGHICALIYTSIHCCVYTGKGRHVHTHPLITSEVCADACLFQLLHLGVNFFRCLTSLGATACSLCKCFFWTSPYLCRLVREQITCLHKKSAVLHILLCLVHRSPFEDGPCYFPSPCSSPGMQIITKLH